MDRETPLSAILSASGPPPTDGPLTFDELGLAARNRGIPLEALRYEITPTGLHYLLVHFDIPEIDGSEWRLTVSGNVEHPLELDLDRIRALPAVTVPVTLECAGNGRARLLPRPISQPWLNEAVSTALWKGTPLAGVLAEAGLKQDTVELVFSAADHGIEKGVEQNYARSLTVAEALRADVLLAYEMNGRELEPQHGFPLRLLVPGWYGMTQVKWLFRIEAVNQPFAGYQQSVAYRFRSSPDDPGTPVQRMRPRALMVPPGFPEFLTRNRLLESGPCRVVGRAWSGAGDIVRVEFGVDDVWRDAVLDEPVAKFAWRRWTFDWTASLGAHVLSCRATDDAGDTQPLVQPWNWQGMGNNLVQTVPVVVR
jgi:sulfane dehydrogenase subunit SoxC